LLHAIDAFVQLADHVATTKYETFRLAHVDVHVNIAVEKHVADVDRVEVQVECSRERCSGANRRRRCCWRIGLEIVDAWTLRESARDELCLESLDHAICVPLGLEHLAVVDRANTWRTLDELPRAIALVRGHLLSKRLGPLCSIAA